MTKSRFSFIMLICLSLLVLPSQQTQAQPSAPNAFTKIAPSNGAAGQPISSLTLRWNASSTPNVTYQYCLRTNKASCPGPKWISVGANTSVTLQSLSQNTRYYWQVRAVDGTGTTEADGNQWWIFTTLTNASLPGDFTKLTPADAAVNLPVNNLTLSWGTSPRATSYQYCVDTVNNNLCDTAWGTTSGLSVSQNGLAYNTLYYWQVRAVNTTGSVMADTGTWFSFQTQVAPPGAFGKVSPVNFAIDQPLSLTLTWGASAGTGITYEYCLDTAPCYSTSTWKPAGASLSVGASGLLYETTYFWQVRAVNSTGTTYADGAQSWSFSTPLAAPGSFTKTSPGNNLTNQPLSLNLAWGASAGTDIRYEYCLSTSTCTPTSIWLPVGGQLTASVSGLAYNTPYFWQVRAVNPAGTTYADGGAVWTFTTLSSPPQPFSKLSPGNASPDPLPVNLTLQWSPSAGASRYFYCVDAVPHAADDTSCASGWVLNDTTTSPHLNLGYNQTYYWQVYAENSQGTLQADSGAWWSFSSQVAPPAAFTKISPADVAQNQPLQPWLYWWTPSSSENTYAYCLDTSVDCAGGTWVEINENVPATVTVGLLHNTTYYWQVRATNTGGVTYANDEAWSFTTLETPPSSSDQPFSTAEDTPLTQTLAGSSNYAKIFTRYGSLPAGTLNLESSGAFTYAPPANFNGTVSFQFILSDGYNPPVGPYTATITVNPVNDAPTLEPVAGSTVVAGKQVASFYAQASDPDLPYGDTLTYSVDEVLPAGASIHPVTGLFRWVVARNTPSGEYTFTVRATDGGGLSDAEAVKITVLVEAKIYLPLAVR